MLQQEAGCIIICKEIRIQIEYYSANNQLDSLDSERDFTQSGEGDLTIIDILKVTESGYNDLSMFETINYLMGDSKKYPYPTTSLQRTFVYKQVICQAKDKF